MKRSIMLLVVMSLLPALGGCGLLPEDASMSDPLPTVSPLAAEEEPAKQTAVGAPAVKADPAAGAAIVLKDDVVYRLDADGLQPIGALPAAAGRLTVGPYNVAYASDHAIHALALGDGSVTTVHDLGPRVGLDWSLCWSHDGASLAYAAAWNEPNGARMVELGVYDGIQQRVVDTLIGRPAGPTPTPPPFPPMEPEAGFANLSVLGYNAVDGALVVQPVGGAERAALWFYDAHTGERSYTLTLLDDTLTVALAPDTSQLALSRPGEVQIWLLASGAQPQTVALPPETHAGPLAWSPNGRRLAYLLHEGAAPGLDASPAVALELWEMEAGPLQRDGQVRRVLAIDDYAMLIGWAGAEGVLFETFDMDAGQMRISLVDVHGGRATSDLLPPGSRVLGWIDP